MAESLADFDWTKVSSERIAQREALIPASYRLPAEYLKASADEPLNVTGIHEKCGLFSQKELQIIKTDAEATLAKYKAKEWTIREVTEAYCKSAAVAHQLVEIFFEEAIKQADEMDALYTKTGEFVGPFHGLPISIKDCFNVPGLPTSLGFLAYALEPMTHEASIVTVLRGLGAVLYCKTNVPTAMMMAETDNRLWGVSSNPHKTTLSTGGSSGGEGALQAMHGAVCGVGTDIGGSIRIPGSYNMLWSLKSSYGRFPNFGTRSGLPGQEAIPAVNGPMSNNLRTLKYFAKSVLAQGPFAPWNIDPKVYPIPYRDVQLPKRLKFGLLVHDNCVRPHPPIERGLSVVADALKAAGHEVIPWDPQAYHAEAHKLVHDLFYADGGKHITKVINAGQEEWYPFMEHYKTAALDPERDLRTSDMWDMQAKRTAFQKIYLDYWKKSGIDAIIMPATPWAACRKTKMRYVGYTCIWNLLDYTAATFPVLFADKSVDRKDDSYKPVSPLDSEIWGEYDAEAYHGGPVGLQLVCGKFEEEKCIEILEVLEKVLK